MIFDNQIKTQEIGKGDGDEEVINFVCCLLVDFYRD